MVKNIVIILVILLVVFFSQQAYFKLKIGNIAPQQAGIVQEYLTRGSNWIKDSAYPKISGEVQKRGDIIKNEVNSEKTKISEDLGTKVKNYFAGVVESIFNPGKVNQNQNQNCPPADNQAQP